MRSEPTDPTLYTWRQLSQDQQQTALAMVRQAQDTRRLARRHRRRTLVLSLLLILALVVVLAFLLWGQQVVLPWW